MTVIGGGGGQSNTFVGARGGSGIVAVRYQLDAVTEWTEHSRYTLGGSARRVVAEDAVNLRIAANETFSILDTGELFVGEDASLCVLGTLHLGADAEVTVDGGVLTISDGGAIGGSGIVHGGLTLIEGAQFLVADPNAALVVAGGTVSLGNLTVGKLLLDPDTVTVGEFYTLIAGTEMTTFQYDDVLFGSANAEAIGGGKYAYFQQGSLQLVVIPEPHTLGLLLGAGALLELRRRRG